MGYSPPQGQDGRDRSQSLERPGPDERLKGESDHLRGTIADSLLDGITAAVAESDARLLKVHGLYQQDDRDRRAERRRGKLMR